MTRDASTSSLLTEPVGPMLLRLSGPVAVGIAAIFLFNAVDTLYVGWLGARELAAMSFTFPVTFMVVSLAVGIGMGVTAVVSRAIGEGDHARVRRLTTDAMLMAVVLTAVVTPIGVQFTGQIFTLLGAPADLIPVIEEYAVPWLACSGVVIVPVIANAALRATGDTKTPSVGMIGSGLVNAVLDPLFIFGLGPVPAMGLRGAAYATMLGWGLMALIAFWAVHLRNRQLAPSLPRLQEALDSAKAILRIGIPAATTNVLVPVGAGVITRLAAAHGQFAVAAYGIGSRIEYLALVGAFALGTAMNPLAGQNYGAGRVDRLRQAVRAGFLYAIVWGGAMALLLGVTAPWLCALFNDDPSVIGIATRFLRTVPASYGFVGGAIVVSSVFNAIDRPIKSASVVLVRIFALSIPLAFLGNHVAGLPGLFAGVALGNFLVGWFALFIVRREVSGLEGAPTTAGLPEPG